MNGWTGAGVLLLTKAHARNTPMSEYDLCLVEEGRGECSRIRCRGFHLFYNIYQISVSSEFDAHVVIGWSKLMKVCLNHDSLHIE